VLEYIYYSPEEACNDLHGSKVGLLACSTAIIAPLIESIYQNGGLTAQLELCTKSIIIQDSVFLFITQVLNYLIDSGVCEFLRRPVHVGRALSGAG
jgi:hypothetical protein